jgi:hypothetical protein
VNSTHFVFDYNWHCKSHLLIGKHSRLLRYARVKTGSFSSRPLAHGTSPHELGLNTFGRQCKSHPLCIQHDAVDTDGSPPAHAIVRSPPTELTTNGASRRSLDSGRPDLEVERLTSQPRMHWLPNLAGLSLTQLQPSNPVATGTEHEEMPWRSASVHD